MDILGSQAGKEKEATLREAMVREESGRGRDFAKSRIYSLLTLIQECALQNVHLQRAPSVRVSKPKCPKFCPFTKPKYLNEFLRTTALLGVRNV